MNQVPFAQLNLSPETRRAIEDMGFVNATEIQAQTIPLIQNGYDVIGRSQTGTGKTVAFGVPAIEAIDPTDIHGRNVQVLILCPTRELASQACDEIKKLSAYKHGIKAADVYGGAPMDRQIIKLKKANIVIGTPGRIMDHMRRKTLKLNHLKMIVLDEADEMLSMGFREDIETILKDTPENRQTILFSATMPPPILQLTKEYQREPQLIEVNKEQATVEKIEQTYYEVPMGRKMDALNLILKYHNPKLSVIFCNTKKMVDEITAYLNKSGFFVEGLHGDMKQSQRTKVMESFKHGQTSILVATDVAARGIDVNDIDYVINYDIPQNYEYYVHRIGRTGRAGKSGKAITICSGRRQVGELLTIGRMVKSKIVLQKLPNSQDIQSQQYLLNLSSVEEAIENTAEFSHEQLVNSLIEKGIDTKTIALAVLEMHFGKAETDIEEIKVAEKPRPISSGGRFQKISISGGRDHRIAPNHIVGAITEKTRLSGKEIGKIEIFDDNSVVSVPESETDHVIESMKNCKINGVITNAVLVKTKDSRPPRSDDGKDYRQFKKRDRSDGRYKKRARF